MTIYTLKEIESVKGRYKFYHLIIDGFSNFERFCNELDEKYKSELMTILSNMNEISKLNRLPETKYHHINLYFKNIKGFEFKSKNLRIYGIHEDDTGKIIILGGFKNQQRKDISKFKSQVKHYMELKLIKNK